MDSSVLLRDIYFNLQVQMLWLEGHSKQLVDYNDNFQNLPPSGATVSSLSIARSRPCFSIILTSLASKRTWRVEFFDPRYESLIDM